MNTKRTRLLNIFMDFLSRRGSDPPETAGGRSDRRNSFSRGTNHDPHFEDKKVESFPAGPEFTEKKVT